MTSIANISQASDMNLKKLQDISNAVSKFGSINNELDPVDVLKVLHS